MPGSLRTNQIFMCQQNLGKAVDPLRVCRTILPAKNLSTLSIGIIGGGIGGVAAAVALCLAGIEATVYERANELREVGAGMMLWPNATRVLRNLGLLDAVKKLSGTNQRFLVRASAGAILMDIG